MVCRLLLCCNDSDIDYSLRSIASNASAEDLHLLSLLQRQRREISPASLMTLTTTSCRVWQTRFAAD